MALLLIATGLATWRAWSTREGACRGDDEVVASIPKVFDDSPDPRLDRLVDASRQWGLGDVVAKVGYDYNQYLSLAALPDDLTGVQTKGSRFFGVLDEMLDPRWGLKYAAGQHSWDVGGGQFISVHRPVKSVPEISSHRLGSGDRRWCRRLSEPVLSTGDRLATLANAQGVTVLAGSRMLTRLDAKNGEPQWQRRVGVTGVDSLHGPWDGVVVAGAAEPQEPAETVQPTLLAFDEQTGKPVWTRKESGSTTVIGSDGGVLVIHHRGYDGSRLIALDPWEGTEQWRVDVDASADTAIRAGVVLIRTPKALRALSLEDGAEKWRTAVRQSPQAFPYGFELGAQPMLDQDTMLLGATDALVELDLTTGEQRRHELPTDGINTTYWPYQVVVSGTLIGVVTNTGAVVLRK